MPQCSAPSPWPASASQSSGLWLRGTQWTPALTGPARGADPFVVEAYTFDRPVRYHLDYQTLRAHREEIRAHRVALTHMSAAMLSRLADAELPAAYDGMIIDL